MESPQGLPDRPIAQPSDHTIKVTSPASVSTDGSTSKTVDLRKRIGLYLLWFGIVYAIFFSLISLTNGVKINLITLEEVLGIPGPFLAVIPMWFLHTTILGDHAQSFWHMMIFFCVVILMAQGGGIHLAANSVARDLVEGAPGFDVAYFWDEEYSHVEFYGAFMIFWVVLLYGHTRFPLQPHELRASPCLGCIRLKPQAAWNANWIVPTVVGSLLYHFFFWVGTIEGQFAVVGFPYSVLVTIFVIVQAVLDRNWLSQPTYLFVLVGNSILAIMYIIWLAWHGSFLELSDPEVGWL